jgi:DNA-binding NarL/FixJ family response regulator
MSAIRLLLVEDSAFTRSTLKAALQQQGIEVVHDTASVNSAMRFAQNLKPDAALLDLDLGNGPNGVDLALGLRRVLPNIGIVLLTGFLDARLLDPKIAHLPPGSRYMLKQEIQNIDTLIVEIEKSISAKSGSDLIKPSAMKAIKKIPDAQIETLRMIAQGLPNSEIAKRREVSEKSVEQAISRLVTLFEIDGEVHNKRVELARIYGRLSGTLPTEGSHEFI